MKFDKTGGKNTDVKPKVREVSVVRGLNISLLVFLQTPKAQRRDS